MFENSASRSVLTHPVVVAVGLYLVGVAAGYLMIIARGDHLGVDNFYHVKVAHELWNQGRLWLDISWLPYTVLGQQGPDHHWGWHLLLAPFAAGDLSEGQVLWVSVLSGAAVFPALYSILRAFRVPYPAFFTLLALAAGAALPFRFMLARTQTLAIVLLFLGCLALVRQWRVGLFVLSFVFMQSYHGAVALLMVVACYTFWDAWLNRRFQFWLLAAAPLGMFSAMLVNPWYPENLEYLFFHVLFKTSNPVVLDVGAEWSPMHWSALLVESLVANVLLLGAITLTWQRRMRLQVWQLDTLLVISVSLVFLVLYRDAWRFSEYYCPFAAVAFALAWRDQEPRLVPSEHHQSGAAAVAVAVLLGLYSASINVVWGTKGWTIDHMKPVQEQLHARAEPGDIVFNSHWGDFTRLLWTDDRLKYVTGLDPNYLFYQDPQRYKLLLALQQDALRKDADSALLIATHFSARWAYISSGHAPLAESLYFSKYATLLSETEYGWLYEIHPAAHPEISVGHN